jgi:phage head maturation protease
MDTKRLTVEIKDADKGMVSAVFSTLEVRDSDGDITELGAFEHGAPVVISAYGHASWNGVPPVGKGAIAVSGTEAALEGAFFMKTKAGSDTFETVKELGDLQEWSYGFDVLESEYGEKDGEPVRFLKRLKVHEVSPVLKGAGVNTRTLAVKGQVKPFVDELTAVLASVTQSNERAAHVLAMRKEKGKGLGAESAGLLDLIRTELKTLDELLTDPEPVQETGLTEAQAEYLRFLRTAHQL